MRRHTSSRARRGSALISAVIFAAIISALTAGIATLTVSQFSRASMEGDYAHALDIAEAGVNLEFNKVTLGASSGFSSIDTTPTTYSFGGGTYTVYCANTGTTTAWNKMGNNLDVVCTGTINHVTRSLRVSCKGYGLQPNFAIFGINSFLLHAPGPTVIGDVGSDAVPSLHGHVTGTFYLAGPDASGGSGAGANPTGGTVYLPQTITYETVSQKALDQFPNSGLTTPGGLAYLATNNDNATKASPALPTTNATITSANCPLTLTGPGNFYVININLVAAEQVIFDNTNGPINLWIGPSGGSGGANLGGTVNFSSKVPLSTTNPVIIYVATTGSANPPAVQMRTSATVTGSWYVYNSDATNGSYGGFSGWNAPVVNGQILAYDFFYSGGPAVNYYPGIPPPVPASYFGFNNSWQETGCSN